MNQQEIEKELLLILQQAQKLQESTDLQSATTEFLRKECEKLEERAKNENLSFQETELLSKQLVAMQARIVSEVEIIEKEIPKMDELQKKIDHLIKLAKTLE